MTSEHRGFRFYYTLCFSGGGGRAQVCAYSPPEQTCAGSATASFQPDGRLVVKISRVFGGGLGLFPRTLRCAPRSGGAAACTLTHHGPGGTTHSTRIVRM
ncbi:MAG: hypothetical protein LBT40_04600 [Deltaproteobacteria bacterium]|nr:hypothetical protein [Deltaproteobacteria bacterium]